MTLRIGVVGAGARSILVGHLAGHDASVVAVADPHPDAAARAARLGDDVQVFASHTELVGIGLDGVEMGGQLPGFVGHGIEAGDDGLLFCQRR